MILNQFKEAKTYFRMSNCVVDISDIGKNLECSIIFFQNKNLEFSFFPQAFQIENFTQKSSNHVSKYKMNLDLNYSVKISQAKTKITGIEKKYYFKTSIFLVNMTSQQTTTIKWDSQEKLPLRSYFNTCTWVFESLLDRYQVVREIQDKENSNQNRKFVLVKNLKTYENRIIKIYDRKNMINKETKKMQIFNLLHEIHLQNIIIHQNIMRFDTFSMDNEHFYLFYQQKPSKIMSEYHKEGYNLPQKRIKELIKQLLNVLCEFHRMRIIHRNVKLSSIFVVEDNQKWKVSLGEFQFAHFICGDSGLKIEEEEKYFLAPELIEKNRFHLSSSDLSDVFSLGLVFYQLLFGQELFKTKMFKKRIQNSLIQLTIQQTLTSNLTVELLLQMLEYNPQKRISPSEALEHDYFTRFEKISTKKSLIEHNLFISSKDSQGFDTLREIRLNEKEKKEKFYVCMRMSEIQRHKRVLINEKKMYQSDGKYSFTSSHFEPVQNDEDNEEWMNDEEEEENLIKVRDVSMMRPGWKVHGCKSEGESEWER